MSKKFENTPFMTAVRQIIGEMATHIGPDAGPIDMFMCGGAAVHWHTGSRVSKDVDAWISKRAILPNSVASYVDDAGERRFVHWDGAFFSGIGLVHPDSEKRAEDGFEVPPIVVKILSPEDLAVMKIGRFSENDQTDIASMSRAGLLDPEKVEALAREALDFYIGNLNMVETSIRDAVEIIRRESPATPGARHGI